MRQLPEDSGAAHVAACLEVTADVGDTYPLGLTHDATTQSIKTFVVLIVLLTTRTDSLRILMIMYVHFTLLIFTVPLSLFHSETRRCCRLRFITVNS